MLQDAAAAGPRPAVSQGSYVPTQEELHHGACIWYIIDGKGTQGEVGKGYSIVGGELKARARACGRPKRGFRETRLERTESETEVGTQETPESGKAKIEIRERLHILDLVIRIPV